MQKWEYGFLEIHRWRDENINPIDEVDIKWNGRFLKRYKWPLQEAYECQQYYDYINRLGSEGWEMISVLPTTGTLPHSYIFKRLVQE